METNFVSDLKTILIPALLADETITPEKQEMYTRLQNVSHFFPSDALDLARNFSMQGFAKNSVGNPVSIGKDGIFGVVDTTNNFKRFRQGLDIYGKFKPAIAPNTMSFYAKRFVWFVDTNVFGDTFTRGLISLVNGGIYQRWRKNAWIESPSVVYSDIFKNVGNDTKIAVQSGDSNSDAEATTREQVTVPFFLYLGMVLVSFVIFVLELRERCKMLLRIGITHVFKFKPSDFVNSPVQSGTFKV